MMGRGREGVRGSGGLPKLVMRIPYRSEGYPQTGYFTPGCVRTRHLAMEPVVMSRRRRRRRPTARGS